jgi:DNA-binding FadR family transcriptional regulator
VASDQALHELVAGTENAEFVDDQVRAVTLRSHKSITTAIGYRLSAIGNRDADTASRRMRRHVHSYAKAALAVDKRDEIAVDE